MTRIASIACALPEHEVSNEDLQREHPEWDLERIAPRSGVVRRRIAAAGETALDLSVGACQVLAEEVDLDAIDAIVYCTQSPTHRVPGDSHLLHQRLDLGDEVFAFDFDLACSGYVYGLAIADSLTHRGLAAEILLVTAETYSKQTDPDDHTTRTLFGDGAAATHVSAGDGAGGRIVAARLGTRGREFGRFCVPVDGDWIEMDGIGVWGVVNSLIPDHIRSFLDERSLTLDEVDLYVFHQASQMTLDSLGRALGLGEDRVYSHLEQVGNLVSASIPFALRAALDEGAIDDGDRVLLCGFGAGFSYGSVLLEF